MNWRTFLILLWLTAYGLVGAVAYERVTRRDPSHLQDDVYVAIGCDCGAVALVATWLAFGNSGLTLRLGIALAALSMLSLLFRVLVNGDRSESNDDFWLMLLLHISAVAAALPMGLMRWRGIRLHTDNAAPPKFPANGPRNAQFSLAALMAIVGCAGALMGTTRWILSLDPVDAEMIMYIGAVVGASAVLAVVVAGLRGYVVFRLLAAAGAVFGIVIGLTADAPDLRNWAMISMSTFCYLLPSLGVLRVCGYRLERVASPKCGPPAGTGESAEEPASPAIPAESRL